MTCRTTYTSAHSAIVLTAERDVMEGDVAEEANEDVDGATEVDGAGHHRVHPRQGRVRQALVDGEHVTAEERIAHG